MAHNIYHNLLIKTSLLEVFEAISEPHLLNNWWTLRSSGAPKIGALYNFYFTPEYNWWGEVSICDPNSSFHIKMTTADADWTPTSFGFDLEEKESGTRVRFSHTNWPKDNDHFKHSSFCWALLLNGLKNYLEKGIIIPFEERN